MPLNKNYGRFLKFIWESCEPSYGLPIPVNVEIKIKMGQKKRQKIFYKNAKNVNKISVKP